MGWSLTQSDWVAVERRRRARRVGAILGALAVGLVGVVWAFGRGERGDPGRLSDVQHTLPADLATTRLADASDLLGEWSNTASSHLSGGVAIADVDGSGLPDVILAGGVPAIMFDPFGDGELLMAPIDGLRGDAVSVTVGDLDADGLADLVFGAAAGRDVIVWGGAWTSDRDWADAEVTVLDGGEPTSSLAIADLIPGGLPELIRLGYGGSSATADVVWRHSETDRRGLEPLELPNSDRRSLALGIGPLGGRASISPDESAPRPLHIWVTRDIGWIDGEDSLYVWDGDRFVDAAPGRGADLAVDGMGVTFADLTEDGVIDVYVSDLGDNEVREGSLTGSSLLEFEFDPLHDTGLARIRPPDADENRVSSSWASGAIDVNLDGRLDIVAVNGGIPGRTVPNKIAGTVLALDDPPAVMVGIGAGRFVDVWDQLGIPWNGEGRGLAIGDLDADGDADMVITRSRGPATLLRNDSDRSSLTVSVAFCTVEVAVATSVGDVTAIAGAPSFLGRHADTLIVGVPDDQENDVFVRVEQPTGGRTIAPGRRDVVSHPCPYGS